MILKYMMQIFHTGTIFFLFLPKKFKCPLFFENKKKKKKKYILQMKHLIVQLKSDYKVKHL